MPFCPQCCVEFTANIKTCPDCNADLIEKLEDDTSKEDYVEIYSVSERMELEVLKSLLEEQGIAYLFRDTRAIPVVPDWRAQFIVEVAVSREADARKLIEEARTDGAITDQGKFL